jgi:HTH-type transcriptional regulator/antitoxin HigA
MAKYEDEANCFARDILIPPDALDDFLRRHGRTLTNEEIHDFAEAIGVGPGIVVGRLQHDGILKWHQGNALKQTVEWGFVEED